MATSNTRYKPPEELGKNKLLSLAMVLKDIHDPLDQQLTVSDSGTVLQIETYGTNDYFWSRDNCFSFANTGGGGYAYDKEQLKKDRLEMLEHLRSADAIIGDVFEMANDDERRRLMMFVGSNWYLGNKKVDLTPRRPIDLLRHTDKNTVWRGIESDFRTSILL
jgi:hypothetical protein